MVVTITSGERASIVRDICTTLVMCTPFPMALALPKSSGGRPICAVVLDLERHARGVGFDEAAVRDGDAVGVAGQIGEHGLGTRERAFGVEVPALPPERSQESAECLRVGQMRGCTTELRSGLGSG
jgi:hypothetical protein